MSPRKALYGEQQVTDGGQRDKSCPDSLGELCLVQGWLHSHGAEEVFSELLALSDCVQCIFVIKSSKIIALRDPESDGKNCV